MKIAQIAPIIERVPPKKYGGTERVVYALTEELVRRGHDVTLFASGDSITSAKLVSVYPRALREAKIRDLYGYNPWTLVNMGLAYSMQDQFDIIHDHTNPGSMPVANIATTPVVLTLHGAFTGDSRKIYDILSNPYLVAISQAQTRPAPNLNYAGVVYNGLPLEQYPFGPEHEDYLLFVGRISPEKGVHFAIEAAKYMNMPLIIAAKLETAEPRDMKYFRDEVEPLLTDQIRWIGEVDEQERNSLMSKAVAMLHPATWREPFGLTLIEAMACGCPVIGFNRGSIPEIIAHGHTGFVVEDVEEMLEAISNIDNIDRAACRRRALENFSAAKMADGYEAIYKKIIEGTPLNLKGDQWTIKEKISATSPKKDTKP